MKIKTKNQNLGDSTEGDVKWQPTPVLLPGESYGGRSLVGYRPWCHKESDTTELLYFTKNPEAFVICFDLSFLWLAPRIPHTQGTVSKK